MIEISKYNNMLVIEGLNDSFEKCIREAQINYSIFAGKSLVEPYKFLEIIRCAELLKEEVKFHINLDFTMKTRLSGSFKLRDYQKETIIKLEENGYRGIVVLPTGSGKTIIALDLIVRLGLKTLVIAPTIELLKQWASNLEEKLNLSKSEIGLYYSERKRLEEITVTTYESASTTKFQSIALDYFGLIIFDEAHHLEKTKYSMIPTFFVTKNKIGFTATLPTQSEKERSIIEFIGPIISVTDDSELQLKGFLKDVEYKRIVVKLNNEERKIYSFLKKNKEGSIYDPTSVMNKLMRLPRGKIQAIQKILRRHFSEKILIYTRFQETAREIAEIFGVPLITSNVSSDERGKIMDLFRKGRIRIIVTAEVLDEGIDVPEVSVVIIVSGRPSSRQFIQRVGRAMRPGQKKGYVYELITMGTKEYKEHLRRHMY